MSKWYGKIGYAETIESEPGIWEDRITEHSYYGETVRNWIKKFQSSNEVNDNINLVNSISILADPFAVKNLGNMRYITFMGSNWKITDVEVQYPRMILTIGGLYNA